MIRIWPLLCVAAVIASDAAPDEPMSRAVLHAHCRAYLEQPGSPGALACEAFVQGYLEGLRSGSRIEARRPDNEGESEAWMDRAARTRLGRAQVRRLRQPETYCVPDDAPVAPIIRRLVERLDAHPHPEDVLAADALAETLRREYRCEG